MVTSLKNLKNQIDSRLAGGGLTDLACCQLQNAQTILNNNIVYSVANTASLPSAALNEGRLVYVDDINEYRISNGYFWSDDVTSTVSIFTRQLWVWGCNSNGELGDGTTTCRCSPVLEFCSATDWCQVSVGISRSGAVKTSGQLWAWGLNTCGSLGDGTTTPRCSPVREFCSATDWCQVSAGGSHASAIKTSGQLWVWGFGSNLGDGTATGKCSPVREFCSATDWCQVSIGYSHTAAIKTSGQLWTWGRNYCGRLGDGTTLADRCSPVLEFCSATDWCQVSAGGHGSAAIKTSGQLWAWGRNYGGSTGSGTTTSTCSPVREFCSATDWCQVSFGKTEIQPHVVALKTSGELWAWGCNGNGRLGDGTATLRCSPVREFCSATDWCQVSAGCNHTAAIKTSGQLWTWGTNSNGQLGDGTVTSRCSPVREICSATDWCQVSAGKYMTSTIKAATKGFFE